jgi:hypothetical protein
MLVKLNVIEKIPISFHTVHVDHVDPFETSRKHNKFLFVIVNAFSKFTITEPANYVVRKKHYIYK